MIFKIIHRNLGNNTANDVRHTYTENDMVPSNVERVPIDKDDDILERMGYKKVSIFVHICVHFNFYSVLGTVSWPWWIHEFRLWLH